MKPLEEMGKGLSPRLRGNPARTVANQPCKRSIPAPAGEPRLGSLAYPWKWVYPRACGGTLSDIAWTVASCGLSPRLRSIPAPAGEPASPFSILSARKVYPRACGGTAIPEAVIRVWLGLSPRLRGNRFSFICLLALCRSIPAPAGEPLALPAPIEAGQVYPRACGGTCVWFPSTTLIWGLSPRLRGNLGQTEQPPESPGSIPAPAGEPSRKSAGGTSSRVYPRACGGTRNALLVTRVQMGLSPRLRGNLAPQPHGRACQRSIPAPAGEPYRHWKSYEEMRVYPRACGGTPPDCNQPILWPGLSPRLRGNREWAGAHPPDWRSIPAPAGEPR